MNRELTGGDGVTADRFAHQLLRKGAIFLTREHPRQHKAAKQIHDHVQRQILARAKRRQFGDVPRPNLIWLAGPQTGNCMVLRGALISPLTALPFGAQQAIDRPQ